MKIGVLTYHNAYNYGAVLQAYALQTFLEERGHEVEIVNYHNKKVDKYYKLFSYHCFPKRNPVKLVRYLVSEAFRWRKFYLFRKSACSLLHVSKRIQKIDDPYLNRFDLVIVGSDQLWNKKITGCNDPFYWGYFVEYTNRPAITYAICMNAENVSSDDYAYIKASLANFSRISVRETSLAEFIKKVSGLEAEVSLDPTLMVDESVWARVASQVHDYVTEPYVCVYPILERQFVVDRAREFAEKKGLKLIVLYPIAEPRPSKEYYVASTPIDFVNIIAHARYVVTSSFHGLAFSIIYNRDVYVFGDAGGNVRMRSLLEALGMRERFMEKGKICEMPSLDYDEINLRLRELRCKSQKYLLDSTSAAPVSVPRSR